MAELLSETYPIRLSPTLRRQLEVMAADDERKAAFIVRRLIKTAWAEHQRQQSAGEQVGQAGEG